MKIISKHTLTVDLVYRIWIDHPDDTYSVQLCSKYKVGLKDELVIDGLNRLDKEKLKEFYLELQYKNPNVSINLLH